ncbi:MAG: sensor histidine kinase [Hyphomicrobiales bacterium]|nr:sensor histidine kinase [Hyphomicrobiales bacterium]MCA1998717.1 sensor histidine kinase [Hyphomicrobiales bacterium]
MTGAGPSLFRRLVLVITLVFGLAAAGLGSAAWIYARIAADEAYDRLLVGAALQIAESIATEPGAVTVDPPNSAFETLALAPDDRIFYRVTDPHGTHLTGQEDLVSALDGTPLGRMPVMADARYRGFPVRIVTLGRYVTGPGIAGWVEVSVAQTRLARLALARDLTLKSVLLVLGMSLLALVALVVAVRLALRPLSQVESAIAARDPKDLRPVAIAAPREIGTLIASINHFLGRLAARIGGMERFIADAAHQMRTPLTALLAQIDLLSAETRADLRRAQIARIRERAEQLGRLTSQLLNHAMVIHRREVVALTPVDLVPLVRAALAETVPLSLDRDIRVGFEAETDNLIVMGDPVSIREVIANLVHNAIRHGAPGLIAARIRIEAGRALVEIADDGPGIAPESWPEVVKPFTRLGVEPAGSGLGLAIAADVMAAHGGTLGFARRADGHFAVLLAFPLAEAGTVPLRLAEAAA